MSFEKFLLIAMLSQCKSKERALQFLKTLDSDSKKIIKDEYVNNPDDKFSSIALTACLEYFDTVSV